MIDGMWQEGGKVIVNGKEELWDKNKKYLDKPQAEHYNLRFALGLTYLMKTFRLNKEKQTICEILGERSSKDSTEMKMLISSGLVTEKFTFTGRVSLDQSFNEYEEAGVDLEILNRIHAERDIQAANDDQDAAKTVNSGIEEINLEEILV